jgi:alpha-mannosidase
MQSKESDYPQTNLGAGSKWIKHLYQDRLDQFLGGHFSNVNLSALLFTHRLDDEKHVKLQVWSAPGRTKPSFQEAMKKKFKPAKKGDSFGPSCE